MIVSAGVLMLVFGYLLLASKSIELFDWYACTIVPLQHCMTLPFKIGSTQLSDGSWRLDADPKLRVRTMALSKLLVFDCFCTVL